MKFCSQCASPLVMRIPADDSRERYICEQCGSIHYENPRNVVGSIPIYGDQVLLCRRAIEPRYGFWTLPAGFLEIGETTSAGAIRETIEEAGANVDIGPLFSLLNVVHAQQVHLFYLAQMRTPDFEAGVESLEVAMFLEKDIPWQDLAFPTVKQTLEWYFADRAAGRLDHLNPITVHTRDVLRSEKI
ncbi:NUDIX hydrolase [Polynucleobacter paneuropaeus]|uniref:NUDIX hydrolase n=1 Tax=Polynucleobacter paneuropaeus TaxID=2527775 RepID=UPI001BFD3A44|nr:NUDIX hydrolase [Polynucleobacter paneuropaeus]MBT8519560.1 NUDIX hydrolase [Polynucleobacter paneuropaeus]MBT8524027.1 NUDIX hydrolase [Polynucleobacter paneuropaeus]MBT8527192.1 NUDIX hydrolase [Polynucleobacter paneuropaeus]MBT8533854.1 NUDIX hydrolase [Polynucleobacter paneuropaeus]MBT8548388.1 NUDIX hydrolase [Polynucleobacter paneuropaeus]